MRPRPAMMRTRQRKMLPYYEKSALAQRKCVLLEKDAHSPSEKDPHPEDARSPDENAHSSGVDARS